MPRVSRTRVPVDSSRLAGEIGARLKAARLAAKMTQTQLADGRYTKAYVSALENGLTRPSMVALQFFADRLHIDAGRLIKDAAPVWDRLEADLALAEGNWTSAADAYTGLLETTTEAGLRAEILRGLAEALTRLGRVREATSLAAESVAIFRSLGRESDAALAEYWLAFAEYQQENSAEAISLLTGILERVRRGLKVEPDFEVRVLMALGTVHSRDGRHQEALAYFEEIRTASARLDDRRRAIYLFDLACTYRETGDFEAAVRTGIGALQLFKKVQADRETAELENDVAMSYLALGNLARAEELAASSAQVFERYDDEWWLCHVLDTRAQIALRRGSPADAVAFAERAVSLADKVGNTKGLIDALLTLGRSRALLADDRAALDAFERAAVAARESGRSGLLRAASRELADALAAAGQHERAFSVMREALG